MSDVNLFFHGYVLFTDSVKKATPGPMGRRGAPLASGYVAFCFAVIDKWPEISLEHEKAFRSMKIPGRLF